MSVVVVGGHDRMICKYKEICKQHNCKSKIFTQCPKNFKGQIGIPDLMIIFTNTVSHKMVNAAVIQAEKNNVTIVRCHTSSGSALKNILCKYC